MQKLDRVPFQQILDEFRRVGMVWVHKNQVWEVITSLSEIGYTSVIAAMQPQGEEICLTNYYLWNGQSVIHGNFVSP